MPKAVDHEQRREQIAHAACGVVARHGFENATVVRIARAAGYTTGMLPHYFASKQDIILAALRLSLTRIEARLDEAGSHGPDLLAVLTEALPIDASRFAECAFWTAFWGQVATDGEARRLNAWVHREYAKLFRKLHRHALASIRGLAAGDSRASAVVDHDVHQRADGERRHEPRRLARRAAGRAAEPAAADAAALGGARRSCRHDGPAAAAGARPAHPLQTTLSAGGTHGFFTHRRAAADHPVDAGIRRTGVVSPRAGNRRDRHPAPRPAARTEGQGHLGRPLCGQHAGGRRRRRARYRHLGALRKGTRADQLRAALQLRRPAVEHPARVRRRAARALPAAVRPRRARRLPGDDRAGRRLRPARHQDHGRRDWRGLRHQRHQALHQPRGPRRLRDPVRRDRARRRTHAARARR